MSPLAYLAVAIVSEVIATNALRLSNGFTRPLPVVFVVVGYCLAFYMLSLALKDIPLGVAYAIWSGIGTAATAILSALVFKDPFNLWTGVGVLLIIGGVIVLNTLGGASHG